MPAHDPAHLCFGKFVAKSDAYISQSKFPVLRQEYPGNGAADLPHRE